MATSKNISIDRLNEHLFDVIERLKSNSDPEADQKDGISNEDAKQIIDASKVIVEGYKCKASVLAIIAHADNSPQLTKDAVETGLLQLN